MRKPTPCDVLRRHWINWHIIYCPLPVRPHKSHYELTKDIRVVFVLASVAFLGGAGDSLGLYLFCEAIQNSKQQQ